VGAEKTQGTTEDHQPWRTAGLDAGTYEALAERLPGAALWSLLLDVIARRAARRTPADLLRQWERDTFTQLAGVDQRTFHALDGHLLEAASEFEAVELSPVAPLGVCSVIGLGSQNRILSALRGTEVVADPTNVLALECARRLRRDPDPLRVIRLVTCQRCVRTQPFPKQAGFAPHFRLFSLVTAGHERKDQRFVTDTLSHHIRTHIAALDRLEQHGYHFPDRHLRLLATAARASLADRIAAELDIPGLTIERDTFDKPYYDGLRLTISARAPDGEPKPFIDGGAFTWVGDLTSNRKQVFVASALGTQAVAVVFPRAAFSSTAG
jgi:hypothetical protein